MPDKLELPQQSYKFYPDNLIIGTPKEKKMENILIDRIKLNLKKAAMKVNDYAAQKDKNRNHTNYGAATAYADVLIDLGHKADIACWEDCGYLKIEKVTIDGEQFNP
jgi:hypothetical protein